MYLFLFSVLYPYLESLIYYSIDVLSMKASLYIAIW